MSTAQPSTLARCGAVGAVLLVTLTSVLAAAAPPRAQRPAARSKAKAAAAPSRTGQQVYARQCASCHGAKGEGGKAYPKALAGTRPVKELAGFIHKSMPPSGKKLSQADAGKVAEYIYDAFYSPVAQARNRPPRVELSRLTVGQYRNAVADLVGSFRPARPAPPSEERGLRGEYYKGRNFRRNDRVLDRVDPQIRFDFADKAPVEGGDAYQFAMRWEGSVLAPDTGEYEFIVRTEHANRLWVNDMQTPLIEAWVKSGSDNEYRASLFLLSGRSYPIRLEFSKSQQGVNNQELLRAKPPEKATLVLEWKPPHRAAEPVPQRCLFPQTVPETFVVTAPFPPDDRSVGYERGTAISKEWEQATTEAALETTAFVAGNLRRLSGAADDAPDRAAKVQEFCKQFVTRAFRRPLTPELEQVFVTRQFEASADLETAVKRVLLLTLKSPRFLYREFGAGASDQYDVASRLSFGLWDSLPDAELLKAAAAGELSTPEQVSQHAERMAADPRAWSKVREFLLQWLKVEHYPDLAKDPKRYPGFDEATANDLRTSLELTLEAVVRSEQSDFRELLLGEKVYLNGRLAKLYGAELPEDAPFQLVTLDPGKRSGILTHPYLLASFAYLDETSPIHRGVLIARSLLGRRLQPPPVAVAPVPADVHPDLTTRQRVDFQTKPAACASCHDMINPLGFTLEQFDAIGRFRTTDNGKPVDATGGYLDRTGATLKFAGAKDLARFLAGSEETQAAFVEQLFQNMVKQPVQAYGPQALSDLRKRFAASGYNIRRQMVETMTVAALLKQ